MGLTRPRAYQIYDLDYKQAVRVVTTSNITLSGGAPNSVDGVTLTLKDRVLVTGQSTGSQNGLYYVTTVGSGNNGTWARSIDGNENGEIDAGMIVMVTEGTTYADTQWKLTTNDPIVIGSTALTFVLNVQANSISSGTSNVVVNANSNVTVSVAGTSNVLTVTSTGANIAGTLNATGNITGGNISTAGQLKTTGTFLLGTQQFYAQGSDGFSVNENFNAGNANVTAYHYTSGAGRNAIVFDTAVTGQFTTGFGTTGTAASNKFVFFAEYGNTVWEWRKSVGISAPNLNGGTLLANISADGNLWTAGTITGTANVAGGNLTTVGQVVATGNITGGNILTSGLLTATGNITGGNLIATGSVTGSLLFATQSLANEGGEISLALPSSGSTLTSNVIIDVYQNRLRFFEGGGTARGAYLDLTSCSAGAGTNLLAGGGGGGTPGGSNTYVQFNDAGAFGGNGQFTYDKVTNILTAGIIAANNNGTGQNFKVGDDCWIGDMNSADTIRLTGIQNGANAYIVFGNSDGTQLGRAGTGPLTYGGAFTATGNVTGGNLITAGITSTGSLTASTTINATGNITGGNLSGTSISGTLTTAAQTNITSVGTLGSLAVTGNITGGNANVAGRILVGSGTAGSPGITFSADIAQDTGLYLVSDGNIGVSTNGTVRATFLDTGLTVTGNITGGGHVGTIYTNSIINTGANGTGNIGSSSSYFNTAFVKATSAQYADLAEMYVADNNYEPGTVVEFGGEYEITITQQSHSTAVAGIISTDPSYLMNATQPGEHVLPVALTGRVPCQVLGPVNKGDVLVSSHIPGVAQRIGINWQPGCVLGKSMEKIISNEVKTIEVAVGRL